MGAVPDYHVSFYNPRVFIVVFYLYILDEDGCSANQIVSELSDGDSSLPSLSFVVSIIAVLGLAILRKPKL
jgi:hypothetical protein